MVKKKRNREEDRRLLMGVAKNFIEPLHHAEFKCPVCGGIATVCVKCDMLIAECHAEGFKAYKKA